MICPGLNDVQTNREVRLFSVSLSDLHYLDLLVVLALRLEVLRARLEAAEEGAPVRVRAVHEDQLPVRQPLLQLPTTLLPRQHGGTKSSGFGRL